MRYLLLILALGSIQANAIEFPSVCFPPDDTNCDQHLVQFIEGAQRSVDVAIYDLNLVDVANALIDVSKRPVTVRVVVDRMQSHESHSLVSQLVEQGIAVKYGHQKGIMHDKYILVDGSRMETGSFNYTNHAARANHENSLYLDWGSIVAEYESNFNLLWAGGDPVTSTSNLPQ